MMGRPGIKRDQVRQMIYNLRAAGTKVTGDSVREILGTGSDSTIHRYLREWRAEQAAGQSTGTSQALPVAFVTAATAMLEQSTAAGKAEVGAKLQVLSDDYEELLKSCAETEGQCEELRTSLSQAHAEIERLSPFEPRAKQSETECENLRTELATERLARSHDKQQLLCLSVAQETIRSQTIQLAERDAELAIYHRDAKSTSEKLTAANEEIRCLDRKLAQRSPKAKSKK